MAIICISISHKTATVAVRQQFAFTKEEGGAFAQAVLDKQMAREMLVLSTCNRTEVYFVGEHASGIRQAWTQYKACSSDDAAACMRIYRDEKAISHLFDVAAGFDSLILGEDEILGQVKEAYEYALFLKTSGRFLNTLFRNAITCAKRIKTDTDLSRLSVSIGTLVAHEVFHIQQEAGGTKRKVTVFIIGLTGTIGTIIRKNLAGQPGVTIIGTKRTHTAIAPEVEGQVQVVDYHHRYEYMEHADVIVSATKSPHYTVTVKRFRESVKQVKPRLFIDLAVPRDIQEEMKEQPDITLKNIDDFQLICKENNDLKLQELKRGERIKKQGIDDTEKELLYHELRQDIPAMAETFAHTSFERILYKLRDNASAAEFAVIADSFRKLIEK